MSSKKIEEPIFADSIDPKFDKNTGETEPWNQEKFRRDSNIKLELKRIINFEEDKKDEQSKIKKEMQVLLKEYNSDFFTANRERNKIKKRFMNNMIKIRYTPFQEFNMKKEEDKLGLEMNVVQQKTVGNLIPNYSNTSLKDLINNTINVHKAKNIFKNHKSTVLLTEKGINHNSNNINKKVRTNKSVCNNLVNSITDNITNNTNRKSKINSSLNLYNDKKNFYFLTEKNSGNSTIENKEKFMNMRYNQKGNIGTEYRSTWNNIIKNNNEGKVKFKKLFESNENWYKTLFYSQTLGSNKKNKTINSLLSFSINKLLIKDKHKKLVLNCKRNSLEKKDKSKKKVILEKFPFIYNLKNQLQTLSYSKKFNKDNKNRISAKDVFSLIFTGKKYRSCKTVNNRRKSNLFLFPPTNRNFEDIYF